MKTVEESIREIIENRNTIMEDFCKAHLAAIYKNGMSVADLIASVKMVEQSSYDKFTGERKTTWFFKAKE